MSEGSPETNFMFTPKFKHMEMVTGPLKILFSLCLNMVNRTKICLIDWQMEEINKIYIYIYCFA